MGGTFGHFTIAWRRYKASWRVLVLSTLVLFASWVALEVAVVALQRGGMALNVALHAGFLVLFSGLMVGMHHMALELVDGQTPRLQALTGFLGRGPRLLAAGSLYSLAVVAGLLLLVVPGIYVAVRYALFGHVIAAGDVPALHALRDAAALGRGRWWSLCRVLALALGLNLIGAALLGIGLFVSFPVSLLATASVYGTLRTGREGGGS